MISKKTRQRKSKNNTTVADDEEKRTKNKEKKVFVIDDDPATIQRIFEENWTEYAGGYIPNEWANLFTYNPMVLWRSQILGIRNPRVLISSGLAADLRVYQPVSVRISTGTSKDQFWIDKPGSKKWYQRLKEQVRNVIQPQEDFDLVLLPDKIPIKNFSVEDITSVDDYRISMMTYDGTFAEKPSSAAGGGIIGGENENSVDSSDGYDTSTSESSEDAGAVVSTSDGTSQQQQQQQQGTVAKIPGSRKEIHNFGSEYQKIFLAAVKSYIEGLQGKLSDDIEKLLKDHNTLFLIFSTVHDSVKHKLQFGIPGLADAANGPGVNGQSLSDSFIHFLIQEVGKQIQQNSLGHGNAGFDAPGSIKRSEKKKNKKKKNLGRMKSAQDSDASSSDEGSEDVGSSSYDSSPSGDANQQHQGSENPLNLTDEQLLIGSRYGFSKYVNVVISTINNTLRGGVRRQSPNVVHDATFCNFTVDRNFENISSVNNNNNDKRHGSLKIFYPQCCSAFVGKVPDGFDGFTYQSKRTRKSRSKKKRNKKNQNNKKTTVTVNLSSAFGEHTTAYDQSCFSVKSFNFDGFGGSSTISSKPHSQYRHHKSSNNARDCQTTIVQTNSSGGSGSIKISIECRIDPTEKEPKHKRCTMFSQILEQCNDQAVELLKQRASRNSMPIFIIPSDSSINRRVLKLAPSALKDVISRSICVPCGDREGEYVSMDSASNQYRFSLRFSGSDVGICNPLTDDVYLGVKEVTIKCSGHKFQAYVSPVSIKDFLVR